MKIDSLSAVRFKGRSFSHDLAACNIVVGSSFSGKTAILDAITVGLLGFHPELGKRTVDTGDLFGEGQTSVTLSLSDGRTIERKWVTKDGKTSDKTAADFAPIVPVALLSLRDWFGLTEQQRVQYIFDRSAAQGEPTELAEELDALGAKFPAAAVEEITEMVRCSIEVKDQGDQKFQDWLNGVIESLKAQAKVAKDKLTLKKGAFQAFKLPAENPKDCSKEVAEAQKAVFEAQAVVDGMVKSQAQAKERIELRAAAEMVAGYEAQIAEEKAKLGDSPTVIDYKVQGDACNTEITRLTDLMRQIERDRDAIHDEETKRKLEYDRLMASEDCPLCKTEGGAWKLRYSKQYADTQQGLKDRDAKLQATFESSAESLATKKAELTMARGNFKVQQATVEARQATEKTLASLVERLGAAREAAAKLSGMPEPPKVDSHGATAALAAAKSRLEPIAIAQKAFDQWKTDRNRQKEAQKACDEASTSHEACKSAQEIAETYRQRIVDGVFGQFIATARKLTDGILVGDLEYRAGEIGRMSNGQWVSHRTFSGTEKAITYAGLSVALAQDSPCKLVLIDEMGIMDAKAKAAVIARMVKLTEDEVIDQAVFCDVSMPETSLLRVNVIEVR